MLTGWNKLVRHNLPTKNDKPTFMIETIADIEMAFAPPRTLDKIPTFRYISTIANEIGIKSVRINLGHFLSVGSLPAKILFCLLKVSKFNLVSANFSLAL